MGFLAGCRREDLLVGPTNSPEEFLKETIPGMDESFDSRLELVVLEGGGQGTRRYLNRTHLTLARLDANDEPQPTVVTFPEPTVSRVHATLEWDPRKHGYVLHHRSRTNATIVNGHQIIEPTLLNVGDKIKMGHLVIELRRLTPSESSPVDTQPQPIETYTYLVVLSGPDKGQLFPLNYNRMVLRQAQDAPALQPSVSIHGVGDVQGRFVFDKGTYFLESQMGVRPIMLHPSPGLIYERIVSTEGMTEFPKNAVLVCGDVAMVLAGVDKAGEVAEAIKAGLEPERIHPALPHIHFKAATSIWEGGEQWVLRVLSGDERGSILWIKPEQLDAPIKVGRRGSDTELRIDLPDPKAGLASIEYTSKGKWMLTNLLGAAPERADTQGTPAGALVHNWDTLTKSEEVYLVSGDRIRMGMTMLSFEYLPTQRLIEAYALRYGDAEMPLIREVNSIGYTPENELRINDRKLAPLHGKIVHRDDAFYYRHEQAGTIVGIRDLETSKGMRTVATGQEEEIQTGDTLVLAEGIEAQFVRRMSNVRPSDPVLIGPTQAEIEARRGGGDG
jgi:pSer/pThr/pTyr-binding forkhead associated (FHA) protein